MKIGIGIDTGGTYTDAVVYDLESRTVLARSKALTTKRELAQGISNALDGLPPPLLRRASVTALSTTLATNACVEGKGGRAKLLLLGTTPATLEWVDAEAAYGLRSEDVLCLPNPTPDWDRLFCEEAAWFADAQALSVAEVHALQNGGMLERRAGEVLRGRFDVPVVLACELTRDLNVLERGATALLNARLLPIITHFREAVAQAMTRRGLDAPCVMVRSDGSLMAGEVFREKPVETILSGPAASVVGGRGLTAEENCLLVDMGGTTTDVSVVQGGRPVMTEGIRIGGWRTQIQGVLIDTFALGGDSAVEVVQGELRLGARRVEPLCVAASRWPQMKMALKKLLHRPHCTGQPLHEFLYLVREPMRDCTPAEEELLAVLKAGPVMLGGGAVDVYGLKSARLEDEGSVMRCGLTPTDAMHIKGDFSDYDGEASRLAAQYLLTRLPQLSSPRALADAIYELVERRLYENLARILFVHRYPKACANGVDAQLTALIRQQWERRKAPAQQELFTFDFGISGALLGVGAPIHLFLPEVAAALGARCVIPEDAAVANAVGAVIADVSARSRVEIRPLFLEGGYAVLAADGRTVYKDGDEAEKFACETARRLAEAEARRRGGIGELHVTVTVQHNLTHAKGGVELDLGACVTAHATGRV